MDGESWYLDKFDQHVCCDCELTHNVKYKVENGRLLTRWTRDDRATKKARGIHGVKVTRVSPCRK